MRAEQSESHLGANEIQRSEPEKSASATLDRVGATASLACAIHCAIMPLVITLLPLIGLSFLADERVEWGLLITSATIGVSSLCMGFREHRSRSALTVLGVGVALVTAGRILETSHLGAWGVPAVVLGGVIIAGAHLINRHLCRTCRACAHHGH